MFCLTFNNFGRKLGYNPRGRIMINKGDFQLTNGRQLLRFEVVQKNKTASFDSNLLKHCYGFRSEVKVSPGAGKEWETDELGVNGRVLDGQIVGVSQSTHHRI